MKEGYIQYNLVSKLIVGVGDVQFHSTNFAFKFFSLNSINGLECPRYAAGFWGSFGKPLWASGWRIREANVGLEAPVAFFFPLSSCLLSVAGESVRLFLCFLFVQHKL